MSTAPPVPRTARRCLWLRVLVVLVGLLVAGAHTEAMAADTAAASASHAWDAEYDVLAATPGSVSPQGRAVAPQRPGPPSGTAPSGPDSPPPAPARAPHSPVLRALRTVVLRC